MLSVPLKPPQLRGAPSTPALRSSTARDSRSFLARKSESNLRNLKFIAKTPAEHNAPSPRRVVYEKLLGAAPGVVRQGDGWTSFSSGRGMAKPASMASLRERAIAFLRDDREPKETRHIVDLAAEVRERRPDTPGTTSVLNLGKGGIEVQGKKKGFLGRLKGMVNGKGKAADNA